MTDNANGELQDMCRRRRAMGPSPLADMTQEGSPFLCAGNRNTEFLAVIEFAQRTASWRLNRQLFNIGIGEMSVRYLSTVLRILIVIQ
jgi:hypothetical protein